MANSISPENLDGVLGSLGEQLQARGVSFELAVIGGSALQALGLVERVTRDVDVVALVSDGALTPAKPLPTDIRETSERVAADFGLAADWLNSGPGELVKWGLPAGFLSRVQTRHYGPGLTVHFASRLDQIHFKLYAMVDQGAGRHEADLRTLNPSRDELLVAAKWTMTHDPSEGFRQQLILALEFLEVADADLEP
jgi:hypothetical protein